MPFIRFGEFLSIPNLLRILNYKINFKLNTDNLKKSIEMSALLLHFSGESQLIDF